MIKDLESDCITCSLFIEIYIIIQRVSRSTFILKYLLFNAAINGIHWLQYLLSYLTQEIPDNFPQTA